MGTAFAIVIYPIVGCVAVGGYFLALKWLLNDAGAPPKRPDPGPDPAVMAFEARAQELAATDIAVGDISEKMPRSRVERIRGWG